MVRTYAVTVTTTATKLTDVRGDTVAGYTLFVANDATPTVYVGGPDVTSATGIPMPTGCSFSADLADNEDLYGVVASGTVPIRVLLGGV